MMKAGYKQTALGLLPNDWQTARVNDVLQLRRGRVISHRDILKAPGPYPVYSSQTMDNGVMGSISSYDFEGEYITWTTDGANAGTVFFRSGKFNCTNVCGTGRPIDPSKSAASYFAYYLDTVAWKHVSHVGNPKLMSGPFGDIPVVVPSSVEQHAIAAALSDADALIASLDALIAKKRDLKQAAMQQLLTGKTRLPGFKGEWEVKRLQETMDCLDNLRVPLNESQRGKMRGDYPYCGANGVLGFVDSYVIDEDIILIAEDGGYFDEYEYRPIAYRMNGKCWVNNHAHILKAKDGFDQGFLFYSLVHKNILSYLANGTRAKLNKSEMWKIEMLLPLAELEQYAIAAVLSDMDVELTAQEAKRDKAVAVKQGMMQELLTGRIRLV